MQGERTGMYFPKGEEGASGQPLVKIRSGCEFVGS